MNQTTVKRLFALSANRCAFPRCRARLIQDGVVIGEMCHINAKEECGPRYDDHQTPEEREAFENFVLMCSIHHKIIDTKPDEYRAEVLRVYKAKHERSTGHGRAGGYGGAAGGYGGAAGGRLSLTPDQLQQFMDTLNIVTAGVVTGLSFNQQGGQTAHKITNVFQGSPKPSLPSLVPIIESHRTSSDNPGQIDYYAFRVSLHNNGDKTVRDYRIEVEIPNAYTDPTHESSMRDRRQIRGGVTVYLDTPEGHGGFILYPRGTSDLLMNINYIMRFEQYKDASGTIKVTVYSDDDLLSSVDFSIADNRNEDRMDQLGLS